MLIQVGDVAADEGDLRAGGACLRARALRVLVLFEVHERDVEAASGQRNDDRAADAAVAAGDQCCRHHLVAQSNGVACGRNRPGIVNLQSASTK